MTTRDRRVATATRQAVHHRNYRRVRDRALARLANAYPETYKELLEQEKVNDITQNKKWLDIDGNTGASLDLDTRREVTLGEQASADHSQGQSNDGGEA